MLYTYLQVSTALQVSVFVKCLQPLLLFEASPNFLRLFLQKKYICIPLCPYSERLTTLRKDKYSCNTIYWEAVQR